MHIKRTFVMGLSVLLCGSASIFAQEKINFSIQGKLDSLGSEKVIFQYQLGDSLLKDSVQAENGVFYFAGNIPTTTFTAIRMKKQYFLPIMVSPGDHVKVSGSLKQLDEVNIKGASHQPVWQAWSQDWKKITTKAGVLYHQLDSIGEKGDRSAVDSSFKALDLELQQAVAKLVKRYPSSPVTAMVINDRFVNYPNPGLARKFYEQLNDSAKQSAYGLALGKAVEEFTEVAVGSVAKNFTLPDTSGKPFTLTSLRGKYVLIDFWASWCVPCRKENPNVVAAYKQYHDKGFDILGVSLDSKKDAWLSAIAKDRLTWMHVSDLKGWKNSAAQKYHVKAVPTNYLLDPEGKIIASNLRGEALVAFLKKLFP